MRSSDFLDLVVSHIRASTPLAPRCSPGIGILSVNIDSTCSVWVGIPAGQLFSTPIVGVVWPDMNAIMRSHSKDMPAEPKQYPDYCGPPVVSKPLAAWPKVFEGSAAEPRSDTSWSWNSEDARAAAAADVAVRIQCFLSEWKTVWGSRQAVVEWLFANAKFGQHAAVLLPALFASRQDGKNFEDYVSSYIRLMSERLAPSPALDMVVAIYRRYIDSLRSTFFTQ